MRLVAVVLIVAAHATASSAGIRPPITGEQLVGDMLADPVVGENAIKRERAMGYIDGIMDVTVGVRWCPAKLTVPHELNYALVEEMKGLGADRLKAAAAPLVVATLARFYPCAVARRQS